MVSFIWSLVSILTREETRCTTCLLLCRCGMDVTCLHLVHHVLLLIELALILSGGILVLLVLGDKVVHVGLSLSELHLVHTLTSVPVKEGLATEHASELLGDTLPELLDGGGVTNEDGSHLETLGGDVADGGHDVVGIEHLLGELGHGEGTVLLGATGGERGEPSEEEVETGEGDEIDTELAEVRVELTREAKAASHTGHAGGAEMVEVTIGGSGELEGTEADVVQGLVVKAHALVGVLHKLVDGEGGVVRLDNSVGHLGGWHHREGEHHAVGVLLADLGDEESSHTGTSTATEGVAELEALEAVARLGLLTHDIEDGVDQLGTLGVVALGPVVTSASLAENKVVGAEELTEGTGTDGVHGTGLEVHKDGTGHVATAGGLVVVHVDALQLEVGVAMVGTCGVDTVLVGDDLPELGTDLVTALASLDVDEFAHV